MLRARRERRWFSLLVFAADWGWGHAFLGFFGFVHGVAGALDGVVEIVLVSLDFNPVGRHLVKNLEKFLGSRGHQIDTLADVFLFFKSYLDEFGAIVNATHVSVEERVKHFGVLVAGGVLQFVLKLLQSIVGKAQEELDALVGRLRVADFVGLQGRQVVLL